MPPLLPSRADARALDWVGEGVRPARYVTCHQRYEAGFCDAKGWRDGPGAMATLTRNDRSHIATRPAPPEARNEVCQAWRNRRATISGYSLIPYQVYYR